MKNIINGLTLYLAIAINIGCNSNSPKQIAKKNNSIDTTHSVKIDTAHSVKIDNYWVTPKKYLEFNSLGKENSDTLTLVICSDYVYSPFGSIKDSLGLKLSLLNNFSITDRLYSTDIEPQKLQILKFKNSRLMLFFDSDPEASTHSYILKGEIHDIEVRFTNNIKIGMSTGDFYKSFFDYFPEEIQQRYKYVQFESCVEDIKHIYTFNNNKLSSVKFISDTYWKLDY
ncbi:hypothetical protein [Mucilaginibacter paludis]|uniref:Uncharacterized protein n=1 Tax=Mucilaginibacter paludis DSM 18603 TaxID=714943 RepID=H1Y5U0_9SPHI|nr:hypothetical protein [Mucilaginibacter paludis]EHQ30362.1 hypothetical protein Mucpa_6306 [Mucilaginibacter paludis DSM 18603]